jgi:hypothetical protein
VLVHVFNENIGSAGIDGKIGKQTMAAWGRVIGKSTVDPHTDFLALMRKASIDYGK